MSGENQLVGYAGATISSSIPKLTGKNYQSWREMIEIVLELRGLKKAVQEVNVDSISNLQAKLIILETLDESHRAQVRGCERAKDILDRLKLIYADTSAANIYRLLLKYYRYEKKSEDTMSEHIGRMDEMRNQLSDLGERQSEQVYQVTLIGSLPKEYSSIMEIWELTHQDMRTTPNLVSRLLKREEDVKVSSASNAFLVHKPKMNVEELKKITRCNNCGQKGHWRRECKNPKKTTSQDRETAMSVVQIEQSQLEPTDAISFSVDDGWTDLRDKWVSDSGASAHMCNNKSWFSALKLYDAPRFCRVGSGRRLEIKGVGSIRVSSSVAGQEKFGILNEVLYVPELATNLFSVGAAADKGISTSFAKDHCHLVRDSDKEIVGVGSKLDEKVYIMDMKAELSAPTTLLATTDTSLEHFHRVLGHASVERVKNLLQDLGIKSTGSSDLNCADCPGGKAKHVSHPSLHQAVNEPGVVHVDLSGLVSKEALQGFRYYLLAKDYYSEFVFAYFCKDKSEVPVLMARLINDFEGLSGYRIKEVHSDNGTEFVNRVLALLLLKEKIKHWTSAPFCPQQNGRIEREMQSTTQIARTILNASGLPKELWREAVGCAVYIRNRLPTKRTKQTPFERFFGRKPNIEHLVEFGAKVHVIANDQYLSKWDSRTYQGFVVGFTKRSNTYRVFLPCKGRVVETCDIVFGDHKLEGLWTNTTKEEPCVAVNIGADVISETTGSSDQDTGAESTGYQTACPLASTTRKTTPEKNICTGTRLERFFEQYLGPDETDEAAEAALTSENSTANDTNEATYQNIPMLHSHHDTLSEASTVAQLGPPPTLREHHSSECPRCNSSNSQSHVEYGLLGALEDKEVPNSYEEAMSTQNRQTWLEPIKAELAALVENETWDSVCRPADVRPLTTKWVFTTKRDATGKVTKHKARLVVRGFEQRQGIDFFQTFAPVARLDSVRLLLAVGAAKRSHIIQFDISTAFLNGKIDENVYIEAPNGYDLAEGRCLKLKRALYGLRQAPRAWNSTFDATMNALGFTPTLSDACVYVHQADPIYLLLYVDDGLIVGPGAAACSLVLEKIKAHFRLRQLEGDLFLGMEIRRDKGIYLRQRRYISDIIARFNLADARSVSSPMQSVSEINTSQENRITQAPYRQAIGCLQYLACCTRPDIAFATNFLAQFNNASYEHHWTAVKRIIKYVKHTPEVELYYKETGGGVRITAFSDADWAGDMRDRKSISGVMILINGAPVIYASRRQNAIALSSTEAEYIAAGEAARELKWLCQILTELRVEFKQPTFFIDNQSTIKQIQNLDTKKRSKHVELRYHFVRKEHREKLFEIRYIESEMQVADMLTKPLNGLRLSKLRKICGMERETIAERHGWSSKLALMILVLIMSSSIVGIKGTRFDRVSPLMFLDSGHQAMEGMKAIQLDLALVTPCDIDTRRLGPADDIKTMLYTHMQELCTKKYQETLVELDELLTCLPSESRPKRVVPLVVAAGAISAAIGGKVAWHVWSPYSSNNRLNRLEDWQNVTQQRLALLEAQVRGVAAEQALARDIHNMTIEALRTNLERHHKNRLDILTLAQVSPVIAWESTQSAQILSRYQEGIEKVSRACRSRRLSIEGLSELVRIPEFRYLNDQDVTIESVHRIRTEAISFSLFVDTKRAGTQVYEVVGLNHWANYSTNPVFVEYSGPNYAIHNSDRDCLKGLELNKQSRVYELCDTESYRDPAFDSWRPVQADEAEIKLRSRPIVYLVGSKNVIYCLYQNATVEGKTLRCPPWPFELSRTKPFNFTGVNYTVKHEHVRQNNFSPRLVPIAARNDTDEDFDQDMRLFSALKDKQDESIRAGQFGFSKGTLTVPTAYVLGGLGTLVPLVAAIITIAQCLLSARAAGGLSEVSRKDETREEQVEITNVINLPAEGHKAYEPDCMCGSAKPTLDQQMSALLSSLAHCNLGHSAGPPQYAGAPHRPILPNSNNHAHQDGCEKCSSASDTPVPKRKPPPPPEPRANLGGYQQIKHV